jgi:hypothetical protein
MKTALETRVHDSGEKIEPQIACMPSRGYMFGRGKRSGRIGSKEVREGEISLQLPSCASWPSPSSSPVRAIRPPTY